MYIRPLTDAEISQIRKVKDVIKAQRQALIKEIKQSREAKRAAIEGLKKQRQALADEIKQLSRYHDSVKFKGLEKQQQALADEIIQLSRYHDKIKSELKRTHDALKPITGKPVFILQGNKSVLLDYELLWKLYKSIVRRRWYCELSIKGKVLSIKYPTGVIELNELPKYQEDLLPVIEIEE